MWNNTHPILQDDNLSEKLTTGQREVYNVVLEMQQGGIRCAKPGNKMSDVDKAVRTISQKGFGSTQGWSLNRT